jgi:hypothetical protein
MVWLAVGEAHRRYTNFINARRGWTGASVPKSVCFGCDGRVASAGGGFLCQPESRASRPGGPRGGLGVVQRMSPFWQGRMMGSRPSVQYSIVRPNSPTCSWKTEMRPLPRFVAPKVPGVRLVLRTLSLGLNAYSDDGLHVAYRKLGLTPSS